MDREEDERDEIQVDDMEVTHESQRPRAMSLGSMTEVGTPGSRYLSPTQSDYQKTEGITKVLKNIARGVSTSLKANALPEEKEKAQKAIEKVDSRYVAKKLGHDNEAILADVNLQLAEARAERTVQLESMSAFQQKQMEAMQMLQENLQLMQQKIQELEGLKQATGMTGPVTTLDLKISPVKPNACYAKYPANPDMMEKAEKSLKHYTQNLPTHSLQKVDGSVIGYLRALNQRATCHHLTEDQTMELMVKGLPEDSQVLTAIESTLVPTGTSELRAVFERLTIMNPAVASKDSLQKSLDNWRINDPHNFSADYDNLFEIYKMLNPLDYSNMIRKNNPIGHKSWYMRLITRVIVETRDYLKSYLTEKLRALENFSGDNEVARVWTGMIRDIGNVVLKKAHQVRGYEERRRGRNVLPYEPDVNIRKLEMQEVPTLAYDDGSDPEDKEIEVISPISKGYAQPIPRSYSQVLQTSYEQPRFPLWITPYPRDAPTVDGRRIHPQLERHFKGYCKRCGSSTHEGSRCFRYNNEADSWNLCEICRQGFHTKCRSGRRELWDQLASRYGPNHIRELENLSQNMRQNQSVVPTYSKPMQTSGQEVTQSTTQAIAVVSQQRADEKKKQAIQKKKEKQEKKRMEKEERKKEEEQKRQEELRENIFKSLCDFKRSQEKQYGDWMHTPNVVRLPPETPQYMMGGPPPPQLPYAMGGQGPYGYAPYNPQTSRSLGAAGPAKPQENEEEEN